MNVKFRMPKFGRDWKLTGMTKELTMSTVATTISIILTFGTAHWVEQRQAEQARKLLAMTAIYDIDSSIAVLKRLKFKEEQGHDVTRYLMENIDRLEEISDDSLFIFFNYVSNNAWHTDDEFLKINENLFNSSQESWSTLDDRTFINNIQTFYHNRAVVERQMKNWIIFKKPVTDEELYQIVMASEGMASRETFLPVCRQLLGTTRVQRYFATSFQRLNFLQQYLNICIDLNEKNKFVMNITEEDMQEFVNNTIKEVHVATEEDLIGTWLAIVDDDQSLEYEFRKDHTYSMHHTNYAQHPIFYGRMLVHYRGSGKWAEENDSLVIYLDTSSLKIEVEDNGITYQPELVDSIRSLKKQICSEEAKQSYLGPMKENPRQPRASNIDRTGKRLELTNPQGGTTHYQRMEATED
jgi:hypothetical protein